ALLLYGAYGKLEPDTGMLARLADTQELALDRVEREWGTEGVGLAFWAPACSTTRRPPRPIFASPARASALARPGR
ncbi:MAG TPA: hypothetical protein VF468_06860, partial [Actinomycetota bacterium]|nr:hypothetical protein [Actinomycetota bacterium]